MIGLLMRKKRRIKEKRRTRREIDIKTLGRRIDHRMLRAPVATRETV